MLKNSKAFSSFSVPDIASAKDFYGTKLGIEVAEKPEGLELSLGGGLRVFIYHSATNHPAEFTVLNFMVDDLEKEVDELSAKGIKMEHYDTADGIKTDEKGIAKSPTDDAPGPRAMAWFKDPAGNILSLLEKK